MYEADENLDDDIINITNLCCNICGETNFNVRDGFYYCQECGTKQEQVRAIEVEQEEVLHDGTHAVKYKFKKETKTEEAELTSWEFYNYVLCGIVEDLIGMGAKEELKLTALQLWTAYLQRNEIAFFSKQKGELPKLGMRFYERDARTIYNHAKAEKPKRVRKDTKKTSKGNEEQQTKRAWKRSKRKLDESAYSMKSIGLMDNTFTEDSMNDANNQSTSRATCALPLQYSTSALNVLEKIVPTEQLNESLNDIKKMREILPKRRDPEATVQQEFTTMNIKQVYGILAISLNHISDDIQLSDLLRFIDEEHISTRNVLRYLPENVRESSKQLLRDFQFNIYKDKYSDSNMRHHIGILARGISVSGFKIPNIFALVQRYIMDLNLPPDLALYIERLLKLLPPKLKTRSIYQYPQYEARAMAYIIFALKIIFGLDDHKERLISTAAKEINETLRKLKETTNAGIDGRHQPLLFVWTEWQNYIEMRKVIISRHNHTYCRHFKQLTNIDQFIEQLSAREKSQKEDDFCHREVKVKSQLQKQTNMRRIFETLLSQLNAEADNEGKDNAAYIAFQPSLMPSHNYFKRLQLHAANDDSKLIHIPAFMHIDHTQRTLVPYVADDDAKDLGNYLSACDYKLQIEELACTEQRQVAGLFRSDNIFLGQRYGKPKLYKACTDVTDEEWLQDAARNPSNSRLSVVFKKQLEVYPKDYQIKLIKDLKKKRQAQEETNQKVNDIINFEERRKKKQKNTENVVEYCIRPTSPISLSSIEMEPLVVDLNEPENQLNAIKYDVDLDSITSAGQEENKSDDTQNKLKFLRSNFDFWTLFGYTGLLTESDKNEIFAKFPASFGWLLDTCANMIGVHWFNLYEQLMVIEMMFTHGVSNLNDTDLQFKYFNPIKDINILTTSFREMW